jgi:8-oxo-dGTP diphosphatase
MPQPHRQCAAVIIQDNDGKILFLEQTKGRYGIPGGIVDPSETPPMAAVREAFEEACIKVELKYIIGTYLLTGGGWPDIFATVYKAKIIHGVPTAGDANEVKAIVWCDLKNLPWPLVPDAEAAIQDLLADKRGVVRTYQRTRVIPTFTENPDNSK